MDLGIEGRIALVTGADSGIGWHTARLLLDEGATVVMSDRDQDALDDAAAQLKAPKGRLHAFAADITSLDSLAELHEKVTDAVGDIDILVQSAGVTGAQGLFHEISDEGWTKTIETDLIGPVRLIRQFLPSLRKGGWGRPSCSRRRTPCSPTMTSCPTARPRPASCPSRRDSRGRTHRRGCS
jgi:NAD(P)-dependent dehydrogenase (short-subunit alcohol dehydrogenase family)